jgi:hypothetical protein
MKKMKTPRKVMEKTRKNSQKILIKTIKKTNTLRKLQKKKNGSLTYQKHQAAFVGHITYLKINFGYRWMIMMQDIFTNVDL